MSMRYWKDMGDATYKGLLEADKGGEMPSHVRQTRMICTPDGFEAWEWDTKAQAWATTDGSKVYVETDKGLMMGLALWRDYRD